MEKQFIRDRYSDWLEDQLRAYERQVLETNERISSLSSALAAYRTMKCDGLEFKK